MDDAFFHAHESTALLRDKLRQLISGASAVTAGNEYLAAYARRSNGNVHTVPTVVDTNIYRPRAKREGCVPVIGWIGSPSTWDYVRPILPVLSDICSGGRARFLAVGAGPAANADRFDGMELQKWSERSEVADVQRMDIGIMPLPDEPWARGKCGYKLIQYMACGLPVVASPVGVNRHIVEEGKSGFLRTATEDWHGALTELIANPALRTAFGYVGRKQIVGWYSLAAQAPRLVEILRTAATASA
jgi:glycosyltransferase involved in cell wall biosynthesis